MKYSIVVFFLFCCVSVFGQNKSEKIADKKTSSFYSAIKFEDHNGHLITDSIQRSSYILKKQHYSNRFVPKSKLLIAAVPLCTNGSFEEFETIAGSNYLKDFQYSIGEPLNPIQCKSVNQPANLNIKQYDPTDFNLMASTVPANFLDEYIGNINGFDQYVLKLNFKHQDLSTLGIVQTKRFKTNNETSIKFNYKAVLQSITDGDHFEEQPYFKARVVNNAGVVVSEFCLIGDPTNCIFSQAPNLEAGSVVLYNPNWQSGLLDISSIPNNQEFTLEFMASRCGLGAHFGYAYVDDICLWHSNENLQGSIELDPLNKLCPTLPLSVCGSFTLPNSGGISATVTTITLNVYDAANAIVYTSQVPTSLDLATHRFCFELNTVNLPDINTGTYNVGATISFGIVRTDCNGTTFSSVSDNDANPGWDIWFLNCTNCAINLHTADLILCDADKNGREFFDLTLANSLVVADTTGLTFTYFNTVADATNNTNPITDFLHHDSGSATFFVRSTLVDPCYKIIPVRLVVKNPTASISGILNVCNGSTVLTASQGSSYLWADGTVTQTTTATAVGTYTVVVTDENGCTANGSVTILNNLIAVQPTIIVTQPTCFVSTGTIAITSPASQYSYDNGATWVTNSFIDHLAVGNYTVKIRTAAGCTSYSTTINIIPFLSSFPDCDIVNPTFCGGFGSITVLTTATMYSFDDGVTWTTNNTATNLPSGTYLVRVKDTFGCISNYNSVLLSSEFLADPLYIKNNPYCGMSGGIEITTPAAQYSFDGGITWQVSNIMNNLVSGSYIIKIKDSQGCTSPNVYVYLTDLQNSYPDYDLSDAGCGVYARITITTPGDFFSFDGGLTWGTNPIKSNLTSGATYKLKVRKGLTCSSRVEYVTIYSYFHAIPTPTDYATIVCDALNDGSENIDLTNYNSNLITNASVYTFKYYTTLAGAQTDSGSTRINNYTSCNISNSNNTVFVRVTSIDNCFEVAKLQFSFIDSPVITMDNAFPLCEFKNVVIDAGPGYDSYLWTTGQITQTISITQPGDYWVIVTENHGALICDSRKDFNIFLSNPATITEVKTSDWTIEDNIIIINVTGLGNYEYSIDGVTYQDSNRFTNLKSGDYKVFVRDKNECGIVDQDVFLLMYPNFFTPNDDGYNDTWKIKFSEFEPGLTIKIFDRNGKFIKQLGNIHGWDGTYEGNALPSSDYWFLVSRRNGRAYRGHFTLKR